jgi:hypothetical protein
MRILISMNTIRPLMSETVRRIAAGQKVVTMECDLPDRTAAARRASLLPFMLLGFIVVVYTLLVPILKEWWMALFAVGPVAILTAYYGIPVSRMKAGLYFKKIDVYENGARLNTNRFMRRFVTNEFLRREQVKEIAVVKRKRMMGMRSDYEMFMILTQGVAIPMIYITKEKGEEYGKLISQSWGVPFKSY